MKVNIYAGNPAGGGVSGYLIAAKEGFARHGITAQVLPLGRTEACDLAVVWGFRKKAEMASGRRALIVERGYVGDRLGTWTSMGFDGLNGRADFRTEGKGPERWDRLFAGYMKPWRDGPGEGHVLIMGQVMGDAALQGFDVDRWAFDLCDRMVQHDLKPLFRPHPRARLSPLTADLPLAGGDLDAAMAAADWVVTYNSNTGVDAVLAGVPTVSLDRGAMAFEVTGRRIFERPPTPDRTQWAAELAWRQWTIDEIRCGDAWDHLKGGMEA